MFGIGGGAFLIIILGIGAFPIMLGAPIFMAVAPNGPIGAPPVGAKADRCCNFGKTFKLSANFLEKTEH
jgi:hypothetical protein